MDNTRPTPLIEDIDGTRRKLESWISAHRGHAVSIPELSIPEATGMSNVTLLFDMTWQEDGQQRSEPVVARLQPSIERPVFPDYDLSLQYEVMEAVGRNSDIPVPAVARTGNRQVPAGRAVLSDEAHRGSYSHRYATIQHGRLDDA